MVVSVRAAKPTGVDEGFLDGIDEGVAGFRVGFETGPNDDLVDGYGKRQK
jgi:hypothetical protein